MPGPVSFPGVYVDEVPSAARGIAGVATSVALFAGWATRGPTDVAGHVSSFAEFERDYGGLDARSLLGYSVLQFFANGGGSAWIMRVAAARGSAIGPADARFRGRLLAHFGPGSTTDRIDLYNLLCVPGLTDAPTLAALQAECRRRRAFLIVDGDPAASAEDFARSGTAGLTGDDASHSAIYFPWVRAPDPLQGGTPRDFPPCGFVAGVLARTDQARGVWKAPAGTDAVLRGATGLTLSIADAQQEGLNRVAINGLRTFPARRHVVWGSRTLHGQDARASEWKYVPVRRLALFLEESLYRGTQWAAFEPNDEPLWAQARLTVSAFMYALFRQGAFQGSSERDAFFVKCGRETTTQADIDAGVLNVHIGFAPSKPAEFVVIRIRQRAGSA